MQTVQFWQLIDQSRQQATAQNQTHAQALSEILNPLSVAEIMAETIRRISNEDSVSSLFID